HHSHNRELDHERRPSDLQLPRRGVGGVQISGGLQFDKGTWSDFGGTTYAPTADGATKEQQIEIATKVRDARGGYGSWPACANKLGLPR
ncbi:transglycosylase family protein, partial [Pseudonocardia alni]|uniref:transglycosylase family protein n=1 Tax=Pseudonocardia alni TaxID=33907 RepID=UPI0033D90955